MKFFIKDIKKYKIKNIKNNNGIISVFDQKDINQINFKRIFFVQSNNSNIRGNHAHKRCYQFMFSIFGRIKVNLDDGIKQKKILLEPMKYGYLIPPSIWAKQKYLGEKSVLGIICSKSFNEKDYIRNYEQFKKIYKI